MANPSKKHDSLFTGAAGEHLVLSHLLRWGLNPQLIAVDTGIDIVAQKGNESFHFQVKTTKNRTAKFSFSESKLVALWEENINLVVVMWAVETKPQILVLPPSLLHMATSGGFNNPCAPIYLKNKRANLRVVFERNGSVYLRERQNDFTPMLSRFDLVESIENDSLQLPTYAYWSSTEKRLLSFEA